MNLKDNIERLNYALKVIADVKEEYLRVREAREKNPDDEAIVKRSDEIQDMLEPIITDTLDDLRNVHTFFMSFQKEMKDSYTRAILSDTDDGSDVTEEDIVRFQAVIEDDEAYNHFINEELPKNLAQAGISKSEYAQILSEAEELYVDDYETVMDRVYKKAILEPDLTTEESRQYFLEKVIQEMIAEDIARVNKSTPYVSVTEQLETTDYRQSLK